MDQRHPHRWMQFSLRSLLLLMLVVASFFAGRMSLQREIGRLRAVENEARRAQAAAVEAEQRARYMAEIARAEAMLQRRLRDETRQSAEEAAATD